MPPDRSFLRFPDQCQIGAENRRRPGFSVIKREEGGESILQGAKGAGGFCTGLGIGTEDVRAGKVNLSFAQ